MKRTIIVVFFCLVFELCLAQPFGILKHFSHDAKLSQSYILDIQQDEKGFIWLGTFNGLIRYDGNAFQNFEVVQRGSLNLSSNRVSSFKFDKSGRIWIKSEKDEVYYFDTENLSFHYPLGGQSKEHSNVFFKEFKLVSSGRVWLFPENKNHLIVLETNNNIKQIVFDSVKLRGSKIKDVFEDSLGTTWFLTDLGICKLKKGAVKPEYFFFNMTRLSGKSYSFSTVTEINDELWFGGANGKLSRYSKKSSTFFDVQLGINSNIVKMKYVTTGKVLIVTSTGGICYYDIKSGKIDVYNSNTVAGFPNGSINYMGLTHSRYFWFEALSSGVYKFDLIAGKLKHLQADSTDPSIGGGERKTFLLTAPNGTVWVQSRGGALAYWDKQQDKLYSISHYMKESSVEVSDVMHAATFDKLGNLWFCSYRKGLDLMIFDNNNFSALKLGPTQDRKKKNVRGLMQDKSGNLWLACRTEKITLMDSKKRKIGMLGADGTLSPNSPGWESDIYHMLEDNTGRIWIGTKGNGLFCLIPRGQPFNYKVIHYKYDELNSFSISSDKIYRIFQAASGKIYLATWGGGVNLIQESNKGIRFINYRNEWKNYPIKSADRVRSIVENKEHQLFFISSYKLFSFSGENKVAGKLEFKEFQVAANDILDIMVTSKNRLALATNGKGLLLVDLNKKGELKIQSFGDETIGFPINEVVAIQEDRLGKFWLLGDNQAIRFDIQKKTAETFPELKSFIGNEIFSEATKCRLANGEIVLGYSNGAICFRPENIKSFTFKPYLAITGFEVNNIELHEINVETPSNPDLLKEVVLEHNQNFFRVQFSALDYINSENIVYRYKLEGIDEDWNYIKGGQSINYTNLSRGKYTLLMSSTNNHNLWMNNERKIKIIILPSIWWTNWAIFCYVLLATGLFMLIRRIFSTIIRLRNDVQIQQEVSELKLKFFTDISHEIRTPLTMITAPLEKMLSDKAIPDSVKTQLQGIERNSNRLLNLVNQILDLRRIQNRKLQVKAIDLGKFTAKVCENFKEISLQSEIRLELNIKASSPVIWADADSLDKILVNLVSNAFKYCHKGDIVELIVEESEKQVVLKVRDNGPGINPVVKKRLFIRFSNYNENPNNPSTGIGLSIVKDLADKHGASIVVDSVAGKGSSFQLCFLKGYDHFNEDVDILFEESEDYLEEDIATIENEPVEAIAEARREGKPVGLIVEDDPELRHFIVSVLEEEYTVYVAENGVEGHLKAESLSPNFIISDIMMPQMDGIEMLKLIRNNIATSHIPVILLSAKTAIESKLEGMEYGADDYLTKPFNVSFLKARVKNILEQRLRLQNLYSTGNITEISENEPLPISNKDQKFMFQVIQFVKENMSKSDFSVEELGKLMYMSRASFFNKLKDITGVSPVVFIRDMRLNEAAELIKNEDMLIKEICFEVGFNDLKYFGKCFKTKFNATPAEYRQLHR